MASREEIDAAIEDALKHGYIEVCGDRDGDPEYITTAKGKRALELEEAGHSQEDHLLQQEGF